MNIIKIEDIEAGLADPREHLQNEIENTAHWRREKAVEFPDDRRNLEAANLLEAMAATVADISPLLMRKYLAVWDHDDDNHDDGNMAATELHSDMLRAVGFSSAYKSATDFVESFLILADKG